VRAAVAVVAAGGLSALAVTAGVQVATVDWVSGALAPTYLFALLLVAGEMRPLVMAREDGEIDAVTVSTTFAVALVLTGPLLLAMAAQGLAVAYQDIWRNRKLTTGLFNVGQYLLTLTATRATFCLATGHDFFRPGPLTPQDIIPGLIAGATFFLANNGMVAGIVALDSGHNPWSIIRGDVQAQGLATSILIGLAPVLALAADFSLLTVPLLVLPLVGVQRSAYLAARRQHEALHDGLTGLPNRTLLHRRARATVRAAVETRCSAAVMLLDLDHFKEVNDTLGHHVGDALLQEVADRVRHACPPDVLVSRLGGDEFAVLVPSGSADSFRELAERLAESLRRPAVVAGVRIAMQSSVGVATAPENARTVEELLQRADIALYRAKENRGSVEVYREEIDTHSVHRLNLFADLHAAVADDQFHVVYQPIAHAHSGRIVGMEALLRWSHPTRGEISPEEFIPLAERSGAISAMSRRTIDVALSAARRVRGRGHDVSVSINLSARLLSDLELPGVVAGNLRRHGVPPEKLTIEVTESTIASDPQRAMQVLQNLREIGVQLSVDDYGTGYSSLSYLSRLHPDELKVDRSFVRQMQAGEQGGVIVRSTIELGHALGMNVTAEGVEDASTYAALVELGCDRIQGFHVARPMPEAVLMAWLDARVPVPRLSEVNR
jgi:diguanylate cyclase (GGDEF)-like protein